MTTPVPYSPSWSALKREEKGKKREGEEGEREACFEMCPEGAAAAPVA
jgi:hypothetical protein